MDNPLISVIIPVYKVEKYLRKCIESVCAQTYRNLEIILVDDGSPDNCGAICDQYAQTDPRIRVIHKENGGLGFARNSGMEICTGAYVMFLDSDDYLSTTAVQALLDRIAADGSDLAMGRHTDVFVDGTMDGTACRWMQDAVISPDDLLAKMDGSHNVPVAVWAKLFKRSLLDTIAYPAFQCAEDLWVFPDLINRCDQISIVDHLVYYYYQRPESLSHAKSEAAKRDVLDATLKMVEYLIKTQHLPSAYNWYSRAIDKAGYMKQKRVAIALFARYFTKAARKQLLQNVTLRDKMKWYGLFVPFGHEIYRWCKKHWT